MAYTNGVFRIDLVSGSDTARTALTSCTASNPSGAITRINKTAHGLVTGAVVDLTGFTAWLNDAWKITVVDADNFDLDGATWQATADPSGTVTPRGGSSWSDAWLTIASGATPARHQPGDEIRFAKTAEPVSLGQTASFTSGSQTVTLTTAVTKKIEDAISGWTASPNITAATNSFRKLGATAVQLTPAAIFTTGKMAYATIAGGGTQDFSSYRYVNFWFRPTSSVSFSAGVFKICLCSDATGDTIINELNFTATVNNSGFHIMMLDYGAALGSNIQSVAIYANSDPSTTVISVNNIFASNGDLTLQTLIGKSGDVNYNIQSIDGTTIKIDSANTSAAGRGYYGTTESATLYYRVPFEVSTNSNFFVTNEAGNALNNFNHYAGGFDTATDTRTGETVFGSKVVAIGGFSLSGYMKLSNFVFARLNASNSTVSPVTYENCVFCGCSTPAAIQATNVVYEDCKFLNLPGTWYLTGLVIYRNCEFMNGAGAGVIADGACRFYLCTFANNSSSSISMLPFSDFSPGIFRRCLFLDSQEATVTSGTGIIFSYDHDGTPGNHWGFTSNGTVNWQTAEFQGSDPGAWRVIPSSSNRGVSRPIKIKLAELAVSASSAVTVTAWVKKSHATNVAAKLYVDGEDITLSGITAAEDVKTNDTNWEELSITFTPTEAGIVQVNVSCWYVLSSAEVYIGSITATQ